MNKETIEKIKEMKEEGKNASEISSELNIPLSTVNYYFDDNYRLRAIERASKRVKKLGPERNEEKYKEYQKEYFSQEDNKEKQRDYMKNYYQDNKEKLLEKQRVYDQKKRDLKKATREEKKNE